MELLQIYTHITDSWICSSGANQRWLLPNILEM